MDSITNGTEMGSALTTTIQYLKSESPMLLLYAHIIFAALFPIYTGAHASLSRPASAAKAKKEQDEEEDDEDTQIMEGLTASDAIVFPLTAGIVLATLYWLIKKYGADMINLILAWYFAGAGIFSTAKLCSDGAELAFSMVLPSYYTDAGSVYEVFTTQRQATSQTTARSSPLPGLFGRLPLPSFISQLLWSIKRSFKQKYKLDMYVSCFLDVKSTFVVLDFVGLLCGIGAVAYNNFIAKPWWLTNVQGFAVSYFALLFISPTSFVVGSLVLSGLFFYDIWAVFFTPLMVTVATNIDQPIKLLFPRPEEDKAYSMLGLGDIVLPGLMIALALRFDLFMHYQRLQGAGDDGKPTKAMYTPAKGHWGSKFWTALTPHQSLPMVLQNAAFAKPYFTATLLGYVVGMVATLGFMTVFKHAQPALLYLVPAVLLSLWGTAAVRGELAAVWAYSEELTGEASETDKKGDAKAEAAATADRTWWQAILESLGFARQPASGDAGPPSKSDPKETKPGKDARADTVIHFSVEVKHGASSSLKDGLKSE